MLQYITDSVSLFSLKKYHPEGNSEITLSVIDHTAAYFKSYYESCMFRVMNIHAGEYVVA